jgi:predicted transcriptional regulator of viral defense system
VIGRLSYEKTAAITRKQFDSYFNNYPKTVREKLIYRLNRQGILKKIKKGVYIYSPLEAGPAGRNINEYMVPGLLLPGRDYYIGYSTMFNYYKFTDQLFRVIYVLNTGIQRDRDVGGMRFKLLKVSKKRMYGITEIDIMGVKSRVSDLERTLVDLIYFSNPVGGLKRAYEIMVDMVKRGRADREKFLEYLALFPNAYVRKRAGYILDSAGIKTGRLVEAINPMSIMTLYNGKSRKGRIDKKWGIIINDSRE